MEYDSYPHGYPSWVDLSTPDPVAAAAFYGELFGWVVEQGPPEAGGYAMATLGGKLIAGLGPQQAPGPPAWAMYVNVDDADAVAAAVASAGGTAIVPPMDVLDAGRMAVFADPRGAVFGVWQPGSHKGAQVVIEPGAFTWSELVTDDVDSSREFYAATLGWGAEASDQGPVSYTSFTVGDRSIAGMMPTPPNVPAGTPPFWAVYFGSTDVDDTVARVTKLGGRVLHEPRDIPAGRFAIVEDPQGAGFGLFKG